MANNLTVGFVPIARPTFDIPLATELANQTRIHLEFAGFSLTGPAELVTSLEQAQSIAQSLNNIDVLLILQTTFADSTMVMSITEAVSSPLVLWAVPEETTGDRLRLNSLCGINLAGHALTRAGYNYDYIYAVSGDAEAVEKIRLVAQAGKVRRILQQARIGRIGEQPDGFDTCRFDSKALQRYFGVKVKQFELPQIFDLVHQQKPEAVDEVLQELHGQLDELDQMDKTALHGTLSTYLTLRQIAEEQKLSGFAVRCWPQFFTDLGCAACGALSMMNNALIPCSCETDVNGTITQLILQSLSGEQVFGSDIVGFDKDEDVAVFWHCGKAPLAMADPGVKPKATIHSNRRLPLLMEFPLKSGRVTVARLSEATGSYRLVVGSGEIVQAPISFGGTTGLLRFDSPAYDVLDTIMTEGLEHHLALTYGDYVAPLIALAKNVGYSDIALIKELK